MKAKKSAMIYPYTNEFTPFLRYWDNDDYEIVQLVSPKGFMLHGKDASRADMGEPLGCIVQSDFEAGLEAIDALILVDYGSYHAPATIDNLYSDQRLDLSLRKAKAALECGKEVLCLADLGTDRTDELLAYAETTQGSIVFAPKESGVANVLKTSRLKITTPVIFVMSESENCGKFSVELGLRNALLEKGYNVSLVGSRKHGYLAGVHSVFPLMSEKIGEYEKIKKFRQYIYDLEKTEDPDVFIIGVPGGLIPFNELFHNGYGIYPYMISQAIRPDFTILCMSHWERVNKAFFQRFEDILTYRFGSALNAIHISRMELDWQKSEHTMTETFSRYEGSLETALKEYKEAFAHSYDLMDSAQMDALADHIIRSLSSDENVHILEEMGEMLSVGSIIVQQ